MCLLGIITILYKGVSTQNQSTNTIMIGWYRIQDKKNNCFKDVGSNKAHRSVWIIGICKGHMMLILLLETTVARDGC